MIGRGQKYWVSLVGLGWALSWWVGCEPTKVNTPERNLERPTRMAQVCLGPASDGSDRYVPLPAEWCAGADCADNDETCQENLSQRALFGLVLNTARGEVTFANLTKGSLVDLAGWQPGYGIVPTGAAPSDVQVTADGCVGLVASGGDCSLTTFDIAGTLAQSGMDMVETNRPLVTRHGFFVDSGRLPAAPGDLVVLPRTGLGDTSCSDSQAHRILVSFPRCGLLAMVDVDSGRVIESVRISAEGVTDAGTDPHCPRECALTDDAVALGGEPSRDLPMHLTFLSFDVSGRPSRLLVAADRAPWFASIPFDPDGHLVADEAEIFTLDPGRKGLTGFRSVRIIGPTVEHDWLFAYLATREGDVRVWDLDQDLECEANPDPSDPLFSDPNWRDQYAGCIPVGQVARAALSSGPGIELPGNRIVVDSVGVYDSPDEVDPDLDTLDPLRLAGDFAYLITLDGQAYLVDVDEQFEPADENHNGLSDALEFRLDDGAYAVLSHQVRNADDTRETEDGRPRMDETVTYLQGGEESVEPPAGITIEDFEILDPRAAPTETWNLVFEGVIPRAVGSSGSVYKPNPANDDPDSAEFRDGTARFCAAGVEPGDMLVLKGCEEDTDCPDGFSCLKNPRQDAKNGGVCLDERYSHDQQVISSCLPLAEGSREYAILEAFQDRLVVGRLPAPGQPCRTVSDCTDNSVSGVTYLCEDGVCVGDCSSDENACSTLGGICREGRCIRAPLPDRRVDLSGQVTWCLPSFVAYEIRPRGQFLLTGSVTGTLLSGKEGPHGECIPDPDRPSSYRARVPLDQEVFENPIFKFVLFGADPYSPPGRDDGISFNVIGGYRMFQSDLSVRLPAFGMWGMDGFVYVVDMGDDTETQGGVTGQVVRSDPMSFSLDPDFILH